MVYSLSALKEKEVINIINGEKLGFIDDVELESHRDRAVAFVIYGRKRFYGLLGKDKDIVIPCEHIKLIGSDTVLVKIEKNSDRRKVTKSIK